MKRFHSKTESALHLILYMVYYRLEHCCLVSRAILTIINEMTLYNNSSPLIHAVVIVLCTNQMSLV